MSEESYEYECMRAELLGLPKPEKKPEPVKQVFDDDEEDEDEIDAEAAKELDDKKEGLNRVGGGLAELNSILSSTQKKLNSLKPNFGSLKDLFRQHLPGDNESGVGNEGTDTVKDAAEPNREGTPGMTKNLAAASKANNEIQQETESQIDKLDALVMKAEHAEMNMAHQNSQMRKFLH